jgi:hypothetical protein
LWFKPAQENSETLSQKKPSQKRAGGASQGVGPEFKLQYRKKTQKQKEVSRFERSILWMG